MKRCTNCGRLLELCEFHRDRGRPYPRCKACKLAYISRRYHARQERLGLARMPR